MERSCLSIVLAAGNGTRMKSSLPKVLHKIAGLPLIGHITNTLSSVGSTDIVYVVGQGAERVKTEICRLLPDAEFYHQKQRLGTAQAVLTAEQAIRRGYDDILIVFGDTPLIEASELVKARQMLADGADIVVFGFHCENPQGYGRLVVSDGHLQAIVEEKDATAQQKQIKYCNGGLLAVSGTHLLELLQKINNENSKGEFYLTDIIALGSAEKLDIRTLTVPYDNIVGVNSRNELAEAEAIWQRRKRKELMIAGVTMIAPETVFLSYDTQIAADVVIEPNVFFGTNVSVASGTVIHAFSHIVGAEIGPNTQIGPFSRLRPGTEIAQGAKVGNFCEVKNTKIHQDAKVNHLTYLGDADIGARANIGAGTISCNYDGFNKWRTYIGADAFVGSNTSLVAPVKIGERTYIASGSVITDEVEDDALAIGRARQTVKKGYGQQLRQRFCSIKVKSEN